MNDFSKDSVVSTSGQMLLKDFSKDSVVSASGQRLTNYTTQNLIWIKLLIFV